MFASVTLLKILCLFAKNNFFRGNFFFGLFASQGFHFHFNVLTISHSCKHKRLHILLFLNYIWDKPQYHLYRLKVSHLIIIIQYEIVLTFRISHHPSNIKSFLIIKLQCLLLITNFSLRFHASTPGRIPSFI